MADEKWSEFLDKQTQLFRQGKITQQQFNESVNQAATEIQKNTKQLVDSSLSLKQSLMRLGTAMVEGKSGASVYNQSISSAANAVGNLGQNLGIFGKVLGTAATAGAKYIVAVNEQADKLFETYQDISRTGLATGMDDVFANLQNMGYTMKEVGKMGALLKENGDVLSNFGGTAANGAKQFGLIARSIEDGDTSTQLKRMGMSVDDINQGTAGYIKTLQSTGALRNQTNEELARGAEEYIKEQDRLTKLTGINAKTQNELYQRALAQQNFGATQAGLERRGDTAIYNRNKELFLRFSTEFGEAYGPEYSGAFAAFASNSVNSPDYRKFLLSFPEAAEMIKGGKATAEEILEKAHQEARKNKDKFEDQALANNAEKTFLSYGGMVEGAQYDQAERDKKNTARARAEQQAQAEGKDKQVKSMVDIVTAQRNQTQAMETLLNVGIKPVTASVKLLNKGIEAVTGTAAGLAGREGRIGGEAKGPPSEQISTADPTKIINFAGRTGDLNHFKQLQPGVYNSFLAMAEEYYQSSGKKLQVNSAYRSPEEQAATDSGNNPKAAPGKSLHQQGKALDINSGQRSELVAMGLLGKHGFRLPAFEDPPHIEMPQAATGGILSGPTSGYQAMLHGTEAVVPMNNKKAITVETTGNSTEKQQLDLIAKKIAAIDMAIMGMTRSNNNTTKILQRQS